MVHWSEPRGVVISSLHLQWEVTFTPPEDGATEGPRRSHTTVYRRLWEGLSYGAGSEACTEQEGCTVPPVASLAYTQPTWATHLGHAVGGGEGLWPMTGMSSGGARRRGQPVRLSISFIRYRYHCAIVCSGPLLTGRVTAMTVGLGILECGGGRSRILRTIAHTVQPARVAWPGTNWTCGTTYNNSTTQDL